MVFGCPENDPVAAHTNVSHAGFRGTRVRHLRGSGLLPFITDGTTDRFSHHPGIATVLLGLITQILAALKLHTLMARIVPGRAPVVFWILAMLRLTAW